MVIGIGAILDGMDESDARYRKKRLDNLQTFKAYRDLFPDAPASQFNSLIDELAGGDRFLKGGLPAQDAIAAMVQRRQEELAHQSKLREREGIKFDLSIQDSMNQALDRAASLHDDPVAVVDYAVGLLPENMRNDARTKFASMDVSPIIRSRQQKMALDLATQVKNLGINDTAAATSYFDSMNVPKNLRGLALDIVQNNINAEYKGKVDAFRQAALNNPTIQAGLASPDPTAQSAARDMLSRMAGMFGVQPNDPAVRETEQFALAGGAIAQSTTQQTAMNDFLGTIYADPAARTLITQGTPEAWDQLDRHVAALLPPHLVGTPQGDQMVKSAIDRLRGLGAATQIADHESKKEAEKAAAIKAFDDANEKRFARISTAAEAAAPTMFSDKAKQEALVAEVKLFGDAYFVTDAEVSAALRSMGTSKLSTAMENGTVQADLYATLRASGVPPRSASQARTEYVSQYVNAGNPQPVQNTEILQKIGRATGNMTQVVTQISKDFTNPEASDATPADLVARRTAAIAKIDEMLAEMQTLSGPRAVYGGPLDMAEVEARRQSLLQLRQRLANLQLPPPPSPAVAPTSAPAPVPQIKSGRSTVTPAPQRPVRYDRRGRMPAADEPPGP